MSSAAPEAPAVVLSAPGEPDPPARPLAAVPALSGASEPAAPTDPAALPLLPVLRLVPAPSWDPPYDDERPEPPVPRLVPLGAKRSGGDPPLRAPARAEQDVRPAVVLPLAGRPDEEAVDAARRRTATAALPSPHRFAHALLQRLLEALAGVRPLAQLQRDLTWEAFAELERRYDALPRTPGPRPTARAVRSVHVQTRPEGVAEVCACVERGPRRAALALRLEGHDGAWRCTDLVGV